MGLLPLLPDMKNCCYCVPDLRVAAAIIAVLGIVTSPSVSWAAVRHAYSLKVSGIVGFKSPSVEIVDLSLQHVVTFGFGSNAGVESSCFGNLQDKTKPDNKNDNEKSKESSESSGYLNAIKYYGWIVLIVDVILMLTSVYLLSTIFKTTCKKVALVFIIVALLDIVLSLFYGLFYIGMCIKLGTNFPVFELVFAMLDVCMWFYFICVMNTFAKGESRDPPS